MAAIPYCSVIPVKAGIYGFQSCWIPAFAGMTELSFHLRVNDRLSFHFCGNTDRDYVDYIYYNPVKHQHVKQVADWPYSTFHRYVETGTYSRNWAGSGESGDVEFGEI
jgi:hypothetical protein